MNTAVRIGDAIVAAGADLGMIAVVTGGTATMVNIVGLAAVTAGVIGGIEW